jgi:hypothetical protein
MSSSAIWCHVVMRDMCSALTQSAKQHLNSNISLQLELRALIKKLDSLLLLENTELYHSSWENFKVKVAQLAAEHIINVDNHHITKLTQTVKALIIIQKKSAQAASISYAVTLRNASVWSDVSAVHEVLSHLVRELMIVCSDTFSQDQEHSIKQIVKKINRLKDSTVSEKVLTVCRLLSENVLITMNTAEIKKQLKCSKSWLSAISQTARVNCCKFTVLMHEVHMSALDCSKQNAVIKKLQNQNQHL